VALDRDFLVVGSGVAGLRAALRLAERGSVLLVTKARLDDSNTARAQGGITAALGEDDTPALHAADTIRAGDGLCDEDAVRILVEEAPRDVSDLLAWGARFDRDEAGRPALGREAAHSVRRVLHARDATGREIVRTLQARVADTPAIHVLEHQLATDLLITDGRCTGVRLLDEGGSFGEVRARATLLATGGAGQVYRETTNPDVATGDGIAMAYRAGARVADMEFVQFHPTALAVPGAPRFLISEALRGEGGRLINAAGEPFMTRYDPAGDLAPRDVVARGIAREVERTKAPVALSLAHLQPDFVRARFPMIAKTCAALGLDLARDPIPVGPAAHYLMGGIETDAWGRTSIPGLFAAGEAACTGVHGANRLASNSLLEGLVFGARAAQAMLDHRHVAAGTFRSSDRLVRDSPTAGSDSAAGLDAAGVRNLLWESAGLFREAAGLATAVARLDSTFAAFQDAARQGRLRTPDDWRLGSLLTVGRLIARAALRRQESRGAHFRTDFPSRDDLHWKFHSADELVL
jgi:L-aspartate oxidase